jgi:uncharacterized protein
MLSERIFADLKQAMLNRDAQTVSVLRMLQAELKNAQISKMGELTPDDEISVIRKEVKKRREAAAQYNAAGNGVRAIEEEAEASILEQYLPKAADEELVRAFMLEVAGTIGELEPKHRGQLIKAARDKFGSSLDGQTAAKLASEIV